MKTNKTLHILECFFNLPDNFNGSLGEALTLMANRTLEAEAYNEIKDIDVHGDGFDALVHLRNRDESKCIIQYQILDT